MTFDLFIPTAGRGDCVGVGRTVAAAAVAGARAIAVNPYFPRDRNRNRGIDSFLRNSTSDYLVMVDDDTPVVAPDKFRRIVAHDAPFVTGVQPLLIGTEFVANVSETPHSGLPRQKYGWPAWLTYGRTEPYQATCCGFGFVAMRRDMLAAFAANHVPWCVEDYGDTVGDSAVTEDVWFCVQAARLGFPLLCDPTLRVPHVKPIDLANIVPAWLVEPVADELA